MGIKQRGSIYDCQKLWSPEVASVIVPFHIYTEADTVSAFYGHGKKSVFQSSMKSEGGRSLLKNLGKELPLVDDTLNAIEKFTNKYVYQDKWSNTLAEYRANK